MTPDYSIVIPVFNSEQSLNELAERIQKVFSSLGKSYEIIFVDDYSSDKSWDAIKSLRQKDPGKVRCIRLAKNYGQHNATLCGFQHATGSFIITLDDDLQNPPEEIPKLIQRIQETSADVVYGISKNQHSLARRTGSGIWKHYSEKFEQGYGNGSSFRLIKSEIIQKIIHYRQYFVFVDQLLYWHTAAAEFVQVEHHARVHGKSRYSRKTLFSLSGNLIIFYTSLPLKLMTYSGIILSFGSMLLALYFILRKIFLHVRVEGFTALIVAILFSTSMMLICFGIIGEYLARIYSVLNERPTFAIKEKQI